jgi:hypothetical protein
LTIRQLIAEQRRRLGSANPAERRAAALLIPAFLARSLGRLDDRQLGQLLEDEVFANFDLLAPEATVSLVAADRLRRLHPRTEKQLGEGMITRVWERLCIGSMKDAERLASDNPMGITTVVSLCPEEVSCKARGIGYVRIPIADAQPILTERFEEIMATIAEHIRCGPVLLLCAAGMSRSPIMAAAWLHRCGYVNFEGALQEIARVRPIIDPSPVLLKSVKEALSR